MLKNKELKTKEQVEEEINKMQTAIDSLKLCKEYFGEDTISSTLSKAIIEYLKLDEYIREFEE